MEIASSNKQDRDNATPINTPEKACMEKKAEEASSEEQATNTSMETILNAIDSLGKCLNNSMEEISS